MTDTIDSTIRDLQNASDLLTAITGRILQVSDRKAGVVMGVTTKVLTGSAFAYVVTGAIGSLGTAGTGAAIAGLSGAAKTTATLYWIGGVVGGGVAAGSALLGVGALGVGIYGSVKVRRAILGHARDKGSLSPREEKILHAANSLVSGIQTAISSGQTIRQNERIVFSRVGIAPCLAEIDHALSKGYFDDLKIYNRARLRGHVINLRSLQLKLERA